MKKTLLVLSLSLTALISFGQCDTEASFDFELIDGVYHFTNTSTGEDDAPLYEWTVDGTVWSDAENPTLGEGDIVDGTVICLEVSDEETACVDEVCVTFEVDEEPCDVTADFEYEVIDGVYHFTNTSVGEGDTPIFEWTVDGTVWSDAENPTLGGGDVEDGTIICLTVSTGDGDLDCSDEICIEIVEEVDPCDLTASFEYELIDGVYHFYNTSTGEWVETTYSWTLNGDFWTDEENPTIGEADIEDGSVICLHVFTHDGEIECEDDICIEIGAEDPCELDANFEYELIDGVYHFYNTSTGEWVGTTYLWTLNGDDWSDDENPTLGEGDVEPGTVICLYVFTHDGEIECEDHICIEMGEEGPCELEAGFEYELIDGAYHFYNTSSGEMDETFYHWSVGGVVWSEAENPTLGLEDAGPGTEICLLVNTHDDINECEDDICMEIAEDVGINTDNKAVLSIYPNPVRDVVTIQLGDNVQIQQIEIYNTIGELVAILPNTTSSQNITADLSELESGIYFIQLLNESGAYLNPQQIVKY